MAEWLCRGLQILVQRFDSASGLQGPKPHEIKYFSCWLRALPPAPREGRGISLEPGGRPALGYRFHISSSREQAIREGAPHCEENMKIFGELRLVRALSDEQIAAMHDPRLARTVRLPTIEDAVKAGGFLAGRPEDIIEALKAVENRYPGLDRVIARRRSAPRSTFSSKTSTASRKR